MASSRVQDINTELSTSLQSTLKGQTSTAKVSDSKSSLPINLGQKLLKAKNQELTERQEDEAKLLVNSTSNIPRSFGSRRQSCQTQTRPAP